MTEAYTPMGRQGADHMRLGATARLDRSPCTELGEHGGRNRRFLAAESQKVEHAHGFARTEIGGKASDIIARSVDEAEIAQRPQTGVFFGKTKQMQKLILRPVRAHREPRDHPGDERCEFFPADFRHLEPLLRRRPRAQRLNASIGQVGQAIDHRRQSHLSGDGTDRLETAAPVERLHGQARPATGQPMANAFMRAAVGEQEVLMARSQRHHNPGSRLGITLVGHEGAGQLCGHDLVVNAVAHRHEGDGGADLAGRNIADQATTRVAPFQK